MGNLLSAITSIKLLIQAIRHQNALFDAALTRIRLSPGIPQPNPTVSQWQVPASPLSDHQSAVLPLEADIVIIGSGITGTAVARTLLSHPSTRNKHISLVDAREICSGATGRNGGHIKESAYLEWDALVKFHGTEAAKEIIAFRLSHLDRLLKMAEEDGLVQSSEIRRVETVDAFFNKDVWLETIAKLKNFQEAFPKAKHEYTILEGEEAQKTFSLPDVCGCITGSSGAVAPYRLITLLLEKLLSSYENFSIDANTPVTSISCIGSGYELTTPRGTIRARHIIHATNAHAPHHLPGLMEKIVPVRGQMTSLRPIPSNASLQKSCLRSWSFFWDSGFDYLTIRPDGKMMLGGGWAQCGDGGLADVGIPADTDNNIYASAHLLGLLPAIFEYDVLRGVEVHGRWTGAMGISVDGLPWVGLVPEQVSCRKKADEGGEWVCAGFSGEGMVNAWGCGEACAQMLLGEDVDMPRAMVITNTRVCQGSVTKLAETVL